ncbi:hypothetical protein ASC64_06915 [Nocardioides sp. Root122]|uniref:magnesium transporter MgtE N-terminal domain-containing protein n=1 Tax=Nocardioides TaxID=1839 RepID=UPI0007036337|nr:MULTISPECIES: hypothetical protein [Nocardioides]KQV69571.1 hypothetical protein ASC64_06915 [Nocardioides sp. Root122]MCK9824503.1 hypothetical protein [Nocardioides cavernae]
MSHRHARESTGPALLSEQVGRRVELSDGTRLGALMDLTVALGVPRPHTTHALVRGSHDAVHLVECDAMSGLTATTGPVRLDPGVDLRTPPGRRTDQRRPTLPPDEVLLMRDVVDTQVVDLQGHHLTRVSDVLLSRDGDRFLVLSVDLGAGAMLRRLGLRRMARYAGERSVDWHDLHLTSPRAHQVQLATAGVPFRRLGPADLAELLARLSTAGAMDLVRALEPRRAAAAIRHSHPRVGRRLMQHLSPQEQHDLVSAAPAEDTPALTHLVQDRAPAASTGSPRRYRRTDGWRLHRPPRR